jgi:SAM-dependent methyltransferase
VTAERAAWGASATPGVAEAFDAISDRYDAAMSAATNPVVAIVRQRVYRSMAIHFPAGSRLLELGCGTGEDAVALAGRGYRIVASDVSPKMVERTRAKVAAQGAAPSRTGTMTGTVTVLGKGVAALAAEWPRLGLNVDGVFSNLAPLNCEPSLDPLRILLTQALPVGGRFVAVVLPRICPLEIAIFLARGQPRAALRRFRRDAVADVDGIQFPMRYYGAGDFDRALGPAFRRVETRSLGLLLPPLALGPVWSRVPGLLPALAAAEDIVGALPGLRGMGDHTLLAYQRVTGSRSSDRAGG